MRLGSRRALAGAFLVLIPHFVAAEDKKPPTPTESPSVQPIPVIRQAMTTLMQDLSQQPALFPSKKKKPRVLTPQEREDAGQAWERFLDYLLALDAATTADENWSTLSGGERTAAFHRFRAGSLARHRFALDWIDFTRHNPALPALYNEQPGGDFHGAYDRLRFRFLNVQRGAEFSALSMMAASLPKPTDAALAAGIQEDEKALWKRGFSSGTTLTLENAVRIVGKASGQSWLPVQTSIANWMGDVKVKRSDRTLVSADQIKKLGGQLEPGDVFLERREWYLSNLGLPGFWTHAALYVGTPEERRRFFSTPEMKAWFAKQKSSDKNAAAWIENLYSLAFPKANLIHEGETPRILEAIGEGVVFTSLEHTAAADSIAVLRPRLSRPDIAMALVRAFAYAGRPYDFEFDFLTDDALVCSELVYKAYLASPPFAGLALPLESMLGRALLPPNRIAQLFDEEAKDKRQFDLVAFLDGYDRADKAVEGTEDSFRSTWKRPKWHAVVTQPPAEPPASHR